MALKRGRCQHCLGSPSIQRLPPSMVTAAMCATPWMKHLFSSNLVSFACKRQGSEASRRGRSINQASTLHTMDTPAAAPALKPICQLATDLCLGDKKPRDASQIAAMQCDSITRGTKADNAAVSAWQDGSDHHALKASPAQACLP